MRTVCGLPNVPAHNPAPRDHPVAPDLEDSHTASYQYKDPFRLLEKEPSGAFKYEWWAILDLNQ